MPGPWENYQAAPSEEQGPWSKYGGGGEPHVDVSLDYNPPLGKKPGFLGGVAETLLPSQTAADYVEGPKFMAQHPIESMKVLGGALLQAHKDQFEKAGISFQDAMQQPTLYEKALSLLEAGGHVAAGALPIVGPAAATAGERIGQGEAARGVGNAVGMLAPFGMSAAAPKIKAGLGAKVAQSAAKDYTDVLHPTTKPLKQLAEQKVVPGMMERRMMTTSREALLEKAQEGIDASGQALDQGYQSLPAGSQSSFTPVLQKLEVLKRDLKVNGIVIDKGKFKAVESIQKDLRGVSGGSPRNNLVPSIDLNQAVKVRQILDNAVKAKKKTFGITGQEGDKLWAQNQAGNAIRANLADEYPNIAQLNKDFSFWKNLEEITQETVTRKAGQQRTPLPQKIITAGALVHGFGWAALTHMLQKFVSSPGWKSVSGAAKSELADLMAGGNISGATSLVKELSGTAGRASLRTSQLELPTGNQ